MLIYNDDMPKQKGGEKHMKNWLKEFKVKMENKGEEIIISIKGDKEKLSSLEKKLKALHELHDCDCDCGCHCC